MDYAFRFMIGGAIVSIFAVVGDILRPKSFAGLFGAAPSVALATLALGFWRHDATYVSAECASMMLGAVALCAYSFVVCQTLMRLKWSASAASIFALAFWAAVAFGSEKLLIG